MDGTALLAFYTSGNSDSVLVLLAALWYATAVCMGIAGLKVHKWQYHGVR